MKANFPFALFVIAVVSLPLRAVGESAQGSPKIFEEVVVLSSPLAPSLFESTEPSAVLSGSDLLNSAKGTLGETLGAEPGVSSSYFGPGASRPVIRGLAGERIRVLENGTGSLDLSAISPDHLTTVEPLLAEHIEVIRGPQTILYGTSAVGGIVNVFDGRIPDKIPEEQIDGRLEVRGGTADLERAAIGKVDVAAGDFVFHLDGFKRRSDDVDIPGFARTEEERNAEPELEYSEPRGTLPFSATESDQLTIGSSYVKEDGFLGFALSDFNSRYGVPNGENDISIDASRERVDILGELYDPSLYISKLKTGVGVVDYDHTEFEGSEVGTKFSNRGLDSRFEVGHHNFANLEGVLGFQFQDGDFDAIGEEAYQPTTKSNIYSLFVYEDYHLNDELSFQLGGRLDWSDYDSEGFDANPEFEEELGRSRPGAASKSFSTFSQSAGSVYRINNAYAVALSLSHTERAPTGQELFADGAHAATAAYEIGDNNLDEERSLGVDLTLRKQEGSVIGSIGGFYNRFWDYIGLNPTGEQALDYDVYKFENQNTEFFGIESKLEWRLGELENSLVSWDIQPDFVYARDSDTKRPLPRIPPFRVRTGFNYKNPDMINARLEVQFNDSQERNADFETETDSYTFLNINVSKPFSYQNQRFEIFLRGTNLTNEKVRDSTSFIKDVAPLPGASVVSGVRLFF